MEERKKDELKKQEMETKEQSEQISREQQGDKVRNSRNGRRNVCSIMLVELLCL